MATTPNYGWTVPEATGYVKDGYSDIATLGDEIDATVFALPAPANVETVLASGTFTSVSALNLSNVLDSTYKYYNLFLHGYVNTSAQDIFIRFRENTTDVATGYYAGRFSVQFNNATSAVGTNAGTAIGITTFDTNSGVNGSITATIHRVSATDGIVSALCWDAFSTRANYIVAERTAMTNFTGLSIYPTSQTMTGSYLLTGIK